MMRQLLGDRTNRWRLGATTDRERTDSLRERGTRRIAIKLGVIVAAIATTTAVSVVVGTPIASATPILGQACASFKNIGDVKGVPIYKGNMCSRILVENNTVTGLKYSWNAYTEVCDWWVDFDFFNGATGEHYFHDQGGQTPGCSHFKHGTRLGAADLPPYLFGGQACATLFTRRTGDVQELIRTCQNVSV